MIKEREKEFLELYSELEKRLSAFALALSRNREDAKDLVAETVLKAYETFDNLKSPQAFASYLFSIASRIHKRKIWRRRLFGGWNESFSDTLPAQDFDPDILFDVEELYKALAKLPNKMREALVLFEISGFSIKEIEEIQSSSNSAVKVRLKRGREKLAEIMRDNEIERKTIKLPKFEQNPNIDNIQLRVGNEKV